MEPVSSFWKISTLLTDPLAHVTPYQLQGVGVDTQSVDVVHPGPFVLS